MILRDGGFFESMKRELIYDILKLALFEDEAGPYGALEGVSAQDWDIRLLKQCHELGISKHGSCCIIL